MEFDSGLPINLDSLLFRRGIEDNRVEFKANWNDQTKAEIIRTVCAFANDLLNLNGGYIVVGVEEGEHGAEIPPKGLDELNLDKIQREINGACRNIHPDYQPILFPEIYQEKRILIIWAPGSDARPHKAPENINQKGTKQHYYVRQGAQTVQARGEILRQLIELSAKVPYDDRRNSEARIEDLSPTLVRRYLYDIRSELAKSGHFKEDLDLFRRNRLVDKTNDHFVPKNVSLLFFNEEPHKFYRGAYVEIVQFSDEGDIIEERPFRGPLPQQIKNALDYLDGLGGSMLQKIRGQAEVERAVPYPYESMEESIVNAVYHRGYDGPPEPTKIYLYPDRMEIISYPGPVHGIDKKHFEPGQNIPPVPSRNRRIGEFLKELRLAEGRGTGIPKIRRKMLENGSPEAIFDFDESRAYFRVILPVHPRYRVIHAMREAGHLWATGDKIKAIDHLERAYLDQPGSGALASQIIEYAFDVDDPKRADKILKIFENQTRKTEEAQPYLTIARKFLDRSMEKDAREILKRIPLSKTLKDTIDAGILQKKAHDYEGAHRLLSQAYNMNPDEPKIVHEYAQTKMLLAKSLKIERKQDITIKRRLNREAAELLRKAIQLSDDSTRQSWCWFDLARTLEWLRVPKSEVEQAYLTALTLSDEPIIHENYKRWREKVKQIR